MPKFSKANTRHFGFKGDYELQQFWVVTFPTGQSTLNDILFETDLFGFQLQLRGGLRGDEIVGIYTNKNKAMKTAQSLLNKSENKYEKVREAYNKILNED
jgi:hypothetical protein